VRSQPAHSAAPAHAVAAAPHARSSGSDAAGQGFDVALPSDAKRPREGNTAAAPQQAGQAGAPNDGTIDAKEGLAALKELADQYGEPIVAQNGNVYMRRKQPVVKDGRVLFAYQLVAKISKGRMMLSPDFVAEQKAAAEQKPQQQQRRVVKEGDRYYWQTMVPGKNGTLIAQLVPMTDAELQSYAAQMQQAEAQQAQQQWAQGKAGWIEKSYDISSKMRLVSTAGNLVNALGQGPDPYTGRSQANWMSGYFLLQMLDGQAQGKLLPQWMKSGPAGITLEWMLQVPQLLGMGRDLQTLSEAFPRTAAVMRAFTAPTRSVLKGASSLASSGWNATLPAGAAAAAAGAGKAAGLAPGMAQASLELARQINAGQVAVVGAPGTAMASKAAIYTSEGLQLVDKPLLQHGMKLAQAPTSVGGKMQAAMTSGIHGALGSMRPFLGMLGMGASLFGTIGGFMNLQVAVKNGGVQSLFTTKQGRSVLTGFLSSASFLGMMMLPALAPTLGASAAVASAGLNVASNIFQGLSMVNQGGLFGSGGYLDSDAVRAAFLIPPLSPVGLAAMWMKRREKEAVAKRKAEEQDQQRRAEQIQAFMAQSTQQLQSAGAIPGAVVQEDGSVLVLSPFDTQGNVVSGAPTSATGAPDGSSPSTRTSASSGSASAGPDPRTVRMLSMRA
jgi:hypothetical protein